MLRRSGFLRALYSNTVLTTAALIFGFLGGIDACDVLLEHRLSAGPLPVLPLLREEHLVTRAPERLGNARVEFALRGGEQRSGEVDLHRVNRNAQYASLARIFVAATAFSRP